MANTYYDATGVLVLDQVTPVIRALFRPFRLDDSFPGNGRAYIARIAEENDPQWSDVLEGLVELAAGLNLPAPKGEPSMVDFLNLLATHFGAAQDLQLLTLIECQDFDGEAPLDALLCIASSFNDGHNLAAIQFEGCWNCSKPRLFEFGGHGSFLSREVKVFTDSSEALKLGLDLRRAILAQDIDAAARHIAVQTRTLLDGIADGELRRQIRMRVAELVPRDPAAPKNG